MHRLKYLNDLYISAWNKDKKVYKFLLRESHEEVFTIYLQLLFK